jgi:hypothetical protein
VKPRKVPVKIICAGVALSNVAFNWAQMPGKVLEQSDCDMLRELVDAWDDARRSVAVNVARKEKRK